MSDNPTYRELIASGKGGKRTRRQFFPVGTLRRSSSKKLKINVTLFTSVPSPGPGSLYHGKALAVWMEIKVVERSKVRKIYELARGPELRLARNEGVPRSSVGRYH